MSAVKVNLNVTTLVVTALAAGTVIYVVRRTNRVGDELRTGLDPTSTENWAYRGANEIGEALTGDEDFNLGGAIFENRRNPLLWPVVGLFEGVRWLRGD